MKTTTTDPTHVMVTGAISFHAALAAIQEFAEKYPIERVSRFQVNAVVQAAETLDKRLDEYEAAQTSKPVASPWYICPVDPAPHSLCLNPGRKEVPAPKVKA